MDLTTNPWSRTFTYIVIIDIGFLFTEECERVHFSLTQNNKMENADMVFYTQKFVFQYFSWSLWWVSCAVLVYF